MIDIDTELQIGRVSTNHTTIANNASSNIYINVITHGDNNSTHTNEDSTINGIDDRYIVSPRKHLITIGKPTLIEFKCQ